MRGQRKATCRYGYRHWFAYYGYVGSSSPVCIRCGQGNPYYRPEDDPHHDETSIERSKIVDSKDP